MKERRSLQSLTTITSPTFTYRMVTQEKSEAPGRFRVNQRVNVVEAHLSQKRKYGILTGLR